MGGGYRDWLSLGAGRMPRMALDQNDSQRLARVLDALVDIGSTNATSEAYLDEILSVLKEIRESLKYIEGL